VDRIRADGICVSVGGKPKTKGPVLHLRGLAKTAEGLSNLPELAEKYRWVAIFGINGAPVLWIAADSLLYRPQMILGYHQPSGCPVLLGVTKACAGHIAIFGQTGTWKSTTSGLIFKQAVERGDAAFFISLKKTDPIIVASTKAAA